MVDFDEIEEKAKKKSTQSSDTSPGGTTILKVFFIGILIFSTLLVSGFLTTGPGPFSDNDNSGDQTVPQDGDTQDLTEMCVQHGAVHYHFNLEIIVDGSLQSIPRNVGIDGNCMRPMHTHSEDNEIHVEFPTTYNGPSPTVGDFFTIWGEPLSDTQVWDFSGNVTVFINGNNYDGDISSYAPPSGGSDDTIELRVST